MCKHVYHEVVEGSYYDKNLECRTVKVKRACIFCGRKEREVTYVKDPPSSYWLSRRKNK